MDYVFRDNYNNGKNIMDMVFQRSEQTGTRTHLEFHSQIWFLPVNTDVNLLSEKLKETMEMRSCANKYSIIIINSKQTYRGSLKEHIVGMEENARREGLLSKYCRKK